MVTRLQPHRGEALVIHKTDQEPHVRSRRRRWEHLPSHGAAGVTGHCLHPARPGALATGGVEWLAAQPAAPPSASAMSHKDQCKDGGWPNYPQFKNQGECVNF